MLIAWLEPATSKVQGDQIYRTRQPCADLAARRGIVTVSGSLLHPAMRLAAQTADVLICAQVVDPDLLGLFATRKAAGQLTIFEINDNFCASTAVGGAGSFYLAPAQRALTLQLAAAADALQVSSATLARLFGGYAKRCEVFVNAVDTPPPLARRDRGDGALVLGWGGSAGHADDLAAMAPTLHGLMAELPELTLAIMGPAAIRQAVDWVPRDRLRYQPDGTLAEYQAFLATLDLGMAPLRDTPFNRGRSDVKALEYASAGAVALVQQAPAYADVLAAGAALGFADGAQLAQHVRALANDPVRAHHLRVQAHAYVTHQRGRAALSARRAAFVAELLAQRGAPLGEDGVRLAAILGHAPGAQRRGRAVHVPLEGASAHLYNGLREVQSGRCGEADFRRAVTCDRLDPLAHLYLGHHAKDAAAAQAALHRARKLAPNSVAIAWACAERALRQGDAAGAYAVWQARPAACATYAPLALCAHRALKALGAPAAEAIVPVYQALADSIAHPDLASALAQAALLQPAHSAAGRRLGRAAEGALLRALADATAPAPWRLQLARLQQHRRAWRQCLATLAPLVGVPAACSPRGPTPGLAAPLVALAHALAAQACAQLGRHSQANRHASVARHAAVQQTHRAPDAKAGGAARPPA